MVPALRIEQKWLNSIIKYISISIYLCIIIVLFCYIPITQLDTNSARYLLSTIVKCEAGIIAIVFSLSLVAVQITSSQFSYRILGIFKKEPIIWITLMLYLLSIIYGLWVLMLIYDFGEGQSDARDTLVLVAYRFGFVVLFLILYYFWKIFDFLNPFYLLTKISKNIDKNSIYEGKDTDSIKIISEIIMNAIYKDDNGLVNHGRIILNNKVKDILDIKFLCKNQQNYINENLVENLQLIIKLSISTRKLEYLKDFSYILSELGQESAKKRFEIISNKTLKSISELGELSLYHDYPAGAIIMIDNLRDVAIISLENYLESTIDDCIESLYKIADYSIKIKYENIVIKVIDSLENMASKSLPKFPETPSDIALDLKQIGENAAMGHFNTATIHSVSSLSKIVQLYLNNNQYEKAKETSLYMKDVAVKANYFKIEEAMSIYTDTIEKLLMQTRGPDAIVLRNNLTI